MTKKDYILIAEALIDSYIATYDLYESKQRSDGVFHVISRLSASLYKDNPRFSGERFMAYFNKEIATRDPLHKSYKGRIVAK